MTCMSYVRLWNLSETKYLPINANPELQSTCKGLLEKLRAKFGLSTLENGFWRQEPDEMTSLDKQKILLSMWEIGPLEWEWKS